MPVIARKTRKLKSSAAKNFNKELTKTSKEKEEICSISPSEDIPIKEVFSHPPTAFGYVTPEMRERNARESNVPGVNKHMKLSEQVRIAETYGGREFKFELVLKTLHRMLMSRIPLIAIAEEFDVSVQTIINWKYKLQERFAKEAKAMNFNSYVGETKAFYEQIAGDAYLEASRAGSDWKARVQSLNIARQCKKDETQFFMMAGYFDTNRFTGEGEEDRGFRQAEIGKEISEGLFDDLELDRFDDSVIEMELIDDAETTKE